MSNWQVIEGDCLEVMRGLPDGSVDLVATDPPYGISFMGKAWDKALPTPAIWQECLRVLKPGGSAVVMSGARLDCLWRLCRDIEAAGFELEQTAFFWCYRSGFPKGGDLSKMADQRAGAEREVVGSRMGAANSPHGTIGVEGGDFKPEYVGTAPATDLARDLDGWFTKGKVKPAVEVIIWARKPIGERTELDNMTKWGVGGVNCGACMVPFESEAERELVSSRSGGQEQPIEWQGIPKPREVGELYVANPAGRFPANLLVTDEALGDGSRYFDIDKWADEHGIAEDGWAEAAAAGVLQVAKPSRREKNAGCDGLESGERPLGIAQWEGQTNGSGEVMGPCKPQVNPHPTCKPVTLFAYLIEFLTRPGATVLDPFAGSGTTGVAALQTGRQFIGCELMPEYVAIAEARCQHAQAKAPSSGSLVHKAPTAAQQSLFAKEAT